MFHAFTLPVVNIAAHRCHTTMRTYAAWLPDVAEILLIAMKQCRHPGSADISHMDVARRDASEPGTPNLPRIPD